MQAFLYITHTQIQLHKHPSINQFIHSTMINHLIANEIEFIILIECLAILELMFIRLLR